MQLQKVVHGKYLLPLALFMSSLALVLIRSIAPVQAVAFEDRSLTLSNNTNAGATATTSYTFSLEVPTGGSTGLRGVEVNFCTTPLFGDCTGPTGMGVTSATITASSPAGGGSPASSDNGTPNAALANGTNSGVRQVRFNWASDQSLTLPQTVTFTIGNIQNPTTVGTFFARVGFFGNGDNTYTTVTDRGVVAQSVQAATNVQFRVQEILQVCTGATTVDSGGGNLYGSGGATVGGDTCDTTGIADYETGVNLGIADPAAIRVTPVATGGSTQGNNRNGFIMVRTNATNTTTIRYRTVQNSGSGELKVDGQACNATPSSVSTDFCINSVPATQTAGDVSAIEPGIEEFGMAAFAINRTAGGATTSLTVDGEYDGTGSIGDTCVTGTGVDCWTWQPDGTAATLATSSGPVDDEAVLLKFAAAASLTTPTGLYQANLDLFAVPTY